MLKLRQQVCPPAQYIQSLMSSGRNKYGLFTNLYIKYYKCLQAITNMSSSLVCTRYCVCRPQQICPPAEYIHYILYPAICTNIYTKYSKCLHAITNMPSSQEGTRYCVCRPQQIYPPAQYIQGIVSAVHNKYFYWAGGHIYCGLQTLVILSV